MFLRFFGSFDVFMHVFVKCFLKKCKKHAFYVFICKLMVLTSMLCTVPGLSQCCKRLK